jgi:hypothetical protein
MTEPGPEKYDGVLSYPLLAGSITEIEYIKGSL